MTGDVASMSRIAVLTADRELGSGLTASELTAASAASVAWVAVGAPGAWNPDEELRHTRGGYGLLVIDGLLVRSMQLAHATGAELLGPGDLLGEPDRDARESASLGFATSWRVIASSRLARLDEPWARRMADYPEIGCILAKRALERTTRLATVVALAQLSSLEDRLWMLLSHFADRFGRVHPDGVHVELPLTHEVLAQLAFARRPSVTSALTRLVAAGRLRRSGPTWILTGDPPHATTA
jgi:CRP/FNR family transcriptional regulator, cyclic AMP receptor protein